MLVTFSTKAYADITMFGDVAKKMLNIMGHSGTIPGALLTDELPSALAKLEQAVSVSLREEQAPPSEDEEFTPSLAHRASPLIKLLQAAIEAHADVMWDG